MATRREAAAWKEKGAEALLDSRHGGYVTQRAQKQTRRETVRVLQPACLRATMWCSAATAVHLVSGKFTKSFPDLGVSWNEPSLWGDYT